MTRTYLISVRYPDGVAFDPLADADDISDACSEKGIDVENVRLWNSPTMMPTGNNILQPPPALPPI